MEETKIVYKKSIGKFVSLFNGVMLVTEDKKKILEYIEFIRGKEQKSKDDKTAASVMKKTKSYYKEKV